jgi:glycosyltransferase involved in cell wall biosynthesis
VVAESETGKEDILSCYGPRVIAPDRIRILPYVSPLRTPFSDDQVHSFRLGLPERYLLYPAQFWPHKNHRRVVQALHLLKLNHGLTIPIVLCGSSEGRIRTLTRSALLEEVRSRSLEAQVHVLNRVTDAEIAALYAGATALVMPTFFGPSNLPILEAWSAGCPVLTSDVRGVRDQAGDAALLVDPASVPSIAEGIRRLWTDEELTRTLAERGRSRQALWTQDDFRRRLEGIVDEAWSRVRV